MGKTEVQDFFDICVAYSNSNEESLRYSLAYVAEKSNPLAEYMAERLNLAFSRSEAASDFVPSCGSPRSRDIHSLRCGKFIVLSDIPAVTELKKHIRKARHIAVLFHHTELSGKLECDFLSFRLRDRIFHYSTHISRPHRSEIRAALELLGQKKVFCFKKERARLYLRDELQFWPQNLIDARDVAVRNGITPTMDEMTRILCGGPFCHRALHFTNVSIPSTVAITHIDVRASLIYEFCKEFLGLNGGEMADAVREEEARSERRRRDRDRRPRENPNPRSRSRNDRTSTR